MKVQGVSAGSMADTAQESSQYGWSDLPVLEDWCLWRRSVRIMISIRNRYVVRNSESGDLTSTIEGQCSIAGYEIMDSSTESGRTQIKLRHTQKWWQTLFNPVVQYKDFVFVRVGENESFDLRIDSWWSRNRQMQLVIFGFVATWLWTVGLANLLRRYHDWSEFTLGSVLVPSLGLLFMLQLSRLILAHTNLHACQLIEAIRSEMRRYGGILEVNSKVRDTKQAALFVTFFVYFVFLCFVADYTVGCPITRVSFNIIEARRTVIPLVMIVLLLFVVAITISEFVFTRRAVAGSRSLPMQPALCTMTAAMFWVLSSLWFYWIDTLNADQWSVFFEIRRDVAIGWEEFSLRGGRPMSAEVGAEILKQFQMEVLVGCGGFAFGWIVGGLMLLLAFVLMGWQELALVRLRSDVSDKSRQATVSGGGFLSQFRLIYGAILACYCCIFVIGCSSLAKAAWQAMSHPSASTENECTMGIVHSLANTLIVLLSLHRDSPWIIPCCRVFIVGWAIVVLCLIVFSVGSYLMPRIRVSSKGRRLDASGELTGADGELYAAVVRFANVAECAAPEVIVVRSAYPHAAAMTCGWRGHKSRVVISQVCIDVFSSVEMEVLLAHEVSHIACGHLGKHEFLHLIGRCMLIDSGFIGAMEDSYGYELEADRCAIERFGIRRVDLKRCLRKIQVVTAFFVGKKRGAGPIAFADMDAELEADIAIKQIGWTQTLKRGFRAWLLLYSSDGAISYWHPSIEDRIKALEPELDEEELVASVTDPQETPI